MAIDVASVAPAATDWSALAAQLSVEFKASAAERERASLLPTEELAKFRESGLVNLLIPERFGGLGGDWAQAVRVIFELGKADPNIGALVSYHYHNYQPPWLDYVDGAPTIQRRSAAERWLWGHVTHPEVKDFYAHPRPDGGFVLRGTKPMNTGPATGDVMNVLAARSDRDELIFAVVPREREGVVFHDDWDHVGLRRTNTSTITFNDVQVDEDEVIPTPEPQQSISRWYAINAGLAFGSTYLGAAFGLLEHVKAQFASKTAPHPIKGTNPAVAQVPFILEGVGRLWIKGEAALAYRDQVAQEYDEAFARDPSPENEELDALHARTETFRVYSARLAIETGSKVFEFLGSSATANRIGLDRYWRDVRIHCLHGGSPPAADRFVGGFYLNGETRKFNYFDTGQSDEEAEASQGDGGGQQGNVKEEQR